MILQSIGPTEFIIIGVIVFLLFGGKKIPELFKGLREAIMEFKSSSSDTSKGAADKGAK